MPLKINGYQPITFTDSDGEFEATPRVGAELRLRLQKANSDTVDNINTLISEIKECFASDENAKRVGAVLDDGLPGMELQKLQSYLFGGDEMVEKLEAAFTSNMEQGLKTAEKGEEQ